MLVEPLALLVVALVALSILLPTRRLYRAGWRNPWLGLYYLTMLGLALAALALRGSGRFLVPFVVVGYLAPFVVTHDRLVRFRRDGPKTAKDVTPRPLLSKGEDGPPGGD